MSDFYTVLRVSKTATAEEIKKSYRKLAVEYHPDRNPGDTEKAEFFRKINEAYEVLGSEEKRKKYDEESSNPKGKKQTKTSTGTKTQGFNPGSFDINDFEKRFESFFGFSKDGEKVQGDGSSQKINTDAMFNSFFKVKK